MLRVTALLPSRFDHLMNKTRYITLIHQYKYVKNYMQTPLSYTYLRELIKVNIIDKIIL